MPPALRKLAKLLFACLYAAISTATQLRTQTSCSVPAAGLLYALRIVVSLEVQPSPELSLTVMLATCRQGIAQLLLAAAEQAAVRAGFGHCYVQASTRQRDTQSPLGGWFNKEYLAATSLYTRTG